MPDPPEILIWTEVSGSIQTAIRNEAKHRRDSRLAGVLLLTAAGLAFLSITVLQGPLGLFLASGLMLAAFAGLLVVERAHHDHLILDAQGLTIRSLWVHRLLSPDRPSVLEMPSLGASAQRLAFVDLAAMGHTADTVWFEDDTGKRTELRLEAFPATEPKFVHDRIEPLWRAMREHAGSGDPAARAQLARLRRETHG